ncbi:CBR-TTR-47 protein [Aphelenchoides bicaudatus]|nr:CBR-TTR-47 protein [Aphelenchoides bicaudatus]
MNRESCSILLALFLSLIAEHQLVSAAGVYSVAVKGTLKCGNEAAPNVKVILYRIDSKDEKQALDSRLSGPSGMFEVNANTNGRQLNETDLSPVVRFYHRCDVGDDKKKDSSRSFQIIVPTDQVTLGKTPKKTFDIGTLNIELTYPKESWEKTPN